MTVAFMECQTRRSLKGKPTSRQYAGSCPSLAPLLAAILGRFRGSYHVIIMARLDAETPGRKALWQARFASSCPWHVAFDKPPFEQDGNPVKIRRGGRLPPAPPNQGVEGERGFSRMAVVHGCKAAGKRYGNSERTRSRVPSIRGLANSSP
jgi:hypothetical protein